MKKVDFHHPFLSVKILIYRLNRTELKNSYTFVIQILPLWQRI